MKHLRLLAFLSLLCSPAFAYEPDEALVEELERRATDIPFLLEETSQYPGPLGHRAILESQRLAVTMEQELKGLLLQSPGKEASPVEKARFKDVFEHAKVRSGRLEAYAERLLPDMYVWTANMVLVHRYVQERCGTADVYSAELNKQASNRKAMIDRLPEDPSVRGRLIDEAKVKAEAAGVIDDAGNRQRYCDGSSTLMRKVQEAQAQKRKS